MPANLTPEYFEAEKLYKQARTDEERLLALEQMLAVIPKHKGTEKLQSDIKKRIARLREGQEKKGVKGGKSGSQFYIPKEGAGQVVVIGAPNSGKSSVLARFTKAQVEVADYPFSTTNLQPGMMVFENVKIQLVDTPPISEDYFEPWMTGIIRNADLVLLVVSLGSSAILEEIELVREKLRSRKVELVQESEEKFKPDGMAFVRAIILGTHLDSDVGMDNLEVVQSLYGKDFEVFGISFKSGEGAEVFPRRIFELLKIVRVYTKSPGKEPDLTDPVVLAKGATVLDFAYSIHKELAKNLKYARIWSKNKYEGLRVARDYVLLDEDICELHS